jgi:hypothetical protein
MIIDKTYEKLTGKKLIEMALATGSNEPVLEIDGRKCRIAPYEYEHGNVSEVVLCEWDAADFVTIRPQHTDNCYSVRV